MNFLLVAVGAAVGAPLRYVIHEWSRARFGDGFPWGTFAVNVAGSGLLGFLVALPAGTRTAALLGTGFCGALTTYSTLALETLGLTSRHRPGAAAANVTLSVLAGLGAATCGLLLAQAL